MALRNSRISTRFWLNKPDPNGLQNPSPAISTAHPSRRESTDYQGSPRPLPSPIHALNHKTRQTETPRDKRG